MCPSILPTFASYSSAVIPLITPSPTSLPGKILFTQEAQPKCYLCYEAFCDENLFLPDPTALLKHLYEHSVLSRSPMVHRAICMCLTSPLNRELQNNGGTLFIFISPRAGMGPNTHSPNE